MSFSITVNATGDLIDSQFAGLFEGHSLAITKRSGDVEYVRCTGLWLDESTGERHMKLLAAVYGPKIREGRERAYRLADIDEIEVLA